MNYKNTDHNKHEMDDMNIRSHLNTSLDLNGISVSEDLINRTLRAIKEQQTKDEEQNNIHAKSADQKVIPWGRYFRGVAGVAAAILVVALGITAMTNRNFESKSDENSSAPESTDKSIMMDAKSTAEEYTKDSDMVADESTLDAGAATTDDELAALEAPYFTITADSALIEDTSDGTSLQFSAGTTEEVHKEEAEERIASGVQETDYTFRDIFLNAPELVEYITITEEVNSRMITLTEQADILEFYGVMDTHRFTGIQEGALEGQDYEVEAKDNQALYTMLVGVNIKIRRVQGEIITESIYQAADGDRLHKELEEFFEKYNN